MRDGVRWKFDRFFLCLLKKKRDISLFIMTCQRCALITWAEMKAKKKSSEGEDEVKLHESAGSDCPAPTSALHTYSCSVHMIAGKPVE